MRFVQFILLIFLSVVGLNLSLAVTSPSKISRDPAGKDDPLAERDLVFQNSAVSIKLVLGSDGSIRAIDNKATDERSAEILLVQKPYALYIPKRLNELWHSWLEIFNYQTLSLFDANISGHESENLLAVEDEDSIFVFNANDPHKKVIEFPLTEEIKSQMFKGAIVLDLATFDGTSGNLNLQFRNLEDNNWKSFRLSPKSQPSFPNSDAILTKSLGEERKENGKADAKIRTANSQPLFVTYLKSFSQNLNQLVWGQPEAVNAFLDIEAQNILLGNRRTAPEVVVLMGLAETGKDTSVEGYVETRLRMKSTPSGEAAPRVEDHIFRYPVIKSPGDYWKIVGSASGYVDAEKTSALNRFLVHHSGGRYSIVRDPGSNGSPGPEYIIENKEWKPGEVWAGYSAPEDGVLFINEFHDWSSDAKNTLLKEALEKGFFEVGNPGAGKQGAGVSRLQVPMTIVIASNDGAGLVAARDQNGARIGEPLSFDQLMARWKTYFNNKVLLKDELANASPQNSDGGTSPEVLTRLPNHRIILMRPLSPATLLNITKMKLQKLRTKFAADKSMGFPKLDLRFSSKLVNFIATYDQIAEEGGRSLKSKIEMIENTLAQAIISRKVKLNEGDAVDLGIQSNADGTYSLNINKQPVLIQYSEKERANQPISDREIDVLLEMENQLNGRVKGIQDIAARLARDIRLAQNSEKPSHPDLATRKADVYAFFGVSSTGKTELAVALHQVLFKTKSKPLVIDFSQIQTVQDLKNKILGSRDVQNKAIASDFMQEYDRAGGRLVVVLDEISNANPAVLTALYDLLREPVMRTCSDGKPRPMGDVKIVMTGNIGEEWYQGIPRDLPEEQQYDAARGIYEKAMLNEGYQRKFLLTRFTEAFVNRITMDRVFFFGPHTPRTIRELIQFKLHQAVTNLSQPKKGARYWDVKFQSRQDYEKTIQTIENYGFRLWEQGASIKNFIDGVLMAEVHDQLLKNKVPSGAQVVIHKLDNQVLSGSSKLGFELLVKGQKQPLKFELPGKTVPRSVRENPDSTLLTAFHEAGHEVVTHVLMGDRVRSKGNTILPGVAEINGQWITYQGIADSEDIEQYEITREVVIAKIAILFGGEVAEQLTTKNLRHTAGKANDIQRATDLAQRAVLKMGLSDKWGRMSVRQDQSMDEFIAGLSATRKKLLEKEVQNFLDQGQALARKVLIGNYENLFLPVGYRLAAQGKLTGHELEAFYEEREEGIIFPEDNSKVKQKTKAFEARIKKEAPPRISRARDFEFFSFIKPPANIVSPELIRQQLREKELAAVDLSAGAKVVQVEVAVNVTKTKPAASFIPAGGFPIKPSGGKLFCRMAHHR